MPCPELKDCPEIPSLTLICRQPLTVTQSPARQVHMVYITVGWVAPLVLVADSTL